MHGGKKLLGLFALAISMALDFFVSSKVPYVDYRIIILLFSVTNIIILFAVLILIKTRGASSEGNDG